MALQIAWLNDRYSSESVYFALLGAPGLDLEAFPAPQVKKTFLFLQHEEVWSVACVKRWPDQVILFDGTSKKPSERLDEDEHRGVRLQRLRHAVNGQLAQLDIPGTVYVCQEKIVSHANVRYSAISCLAWTEAKLCRWRIDHNWDQFEHPCWLPTADICSEFAKMVDTGDTDWNDVLWERARMANPARLTGA
ncbi:hypothetical protein B0J18DRAFT_276290 [Chaetomium sp. MPI-SDFR-AT-0129]|nr:hypothetical protein B0J18DRAFT_276290 [Chaetomium sp. MPI-SDFR-AT-0129]